MVELKIYYGTVIDNDDTNSDDREKLSRVKVMLLPEMKDIASSYLPWLRPFFVKGMSTDSFSHMSPEIGDKVWCIFLDPYFKTGYYFSGAFIDGFFDENTIITTLSNISESITTTYPHLKFYLLPEGTILFFNTLTGDMGIYHNTGSYLIIDNSGAFYLYSGENEVKIYNDNGHLLLNEDGEVEASGSAKSLVTHAELASAISTFMNALNLHVHTGVTTGAGSSGPPVGAMSLDISTAESDRYKED